MNTFRNTARSDRYFLLFKLEPSGISNKDKLAV